MKTMALYTSKHPGKHHKRAAKNEQDNDSVSDDGGHETLQGGFVVHDVIRENTRCSERKGKQQNSEKALCVTHKAQATGLVRMRRKQLQVETTNTRKKLKPEKEPPE